MRLPPHILVVNGIKVRRPVFLLGAPHSGRLPLSGWKGLTGRRGRERSSVMESRDVAAAMMTVALVMAGVILAAVILDRFGVPFAATGDRPEA